MKKIKNNFLIMGYKVNTSFLTKLPHFQICGAKVGQSYKNGVFVVKNINRVENACSAKVYFFKVFR